MNSSKQVLKDVVSLCRRRGFVLPTQEGEYVYGPLGVELKHNLIREWWHEVTVDGDVHGLECSVLASPTSNRVDSLNSRVQDSRDQLGLRSQLCHGAVTHFLECARSLGLQLPFGIAEVGRVFRRETQPEHFMHSLREFDQMSLQYFCPPSESNEWYAHWQKRRLRWWRRFANHPERFSITELAPNKLDKSIVRHSIIQFEFPWGRSDIEKLTNHGEAEMTSLTADMEREGSTEKLMETGDDKPLPFLISCTAGVDRAMLACLCDAFTETRTPRGLKSSEFKLGTVLQLHLCLAPYKVAILPVEGSDQKLCMYCRQLADELSHAGIKTAYSGAGSFDYRLAVQNEVGTPYCIFADQSTLETGIVALQDRDTVVQEHMNGQDVLFSLLRILQSARL